MAIPPFVYFVSRSPKWRLSRVPQNHRRTGHLSTGEAVGIFGQTEYIYEVPNRLEDNLSFMTRKHLA